jgi:hypothetical protein
MHARSWRWKACKGKNQDTHYKYLMIILKSKENIRSISNK